MAKNDQLSGQKRSKKMAMFGLVDVDQGIGMLAVLPGGLFELILPLWLFVKGFRSQAIGFGPSQNGGL
jgi:hypothetical protein